MKQTMFTPAPNTTTTGWFIIDPGYVDINLLSRLVYLQPTNIRDAFISEDWVCTLKPVESPDGKCKFVRYAGLADVEFKTEH